METFHFKFHVFIILLVFFNLFSVNWAIGRCLQEENLALLQLKKGFTSGNLESWSPGTDCCIWEGVTCDESARITSLDLGARSIAGKIDPSLFNLTYLRSLNFAINKFVGIPIPDSGWDRLVNLSSLDLSYNGFVGKVPASIFRLLKLTILNLSFNSGLSLTINPTIFGNMSSLKELFLDNVNVSSYRDEWCSALVNSTPVLEVLSMGNCSLFGPICSSLSMLPFLSNIYLDFNNLDSSISDSFANFSFLSELQIRSNNFQGFFPKQIFQLRNLKYVDISFNSMLSGYLPNFLEYNNLQGLWVSNTNFSGNLPDSMCNLKLLIALDLSSCQFYGIMPSFMRNLSQLAYLDLSDNNFNGVVELKFIKNLKNLSYLALSNSGFSLSLRDADIGSSLSSFPKLLTLNLNGCNLMKIPAFIKYQNWMMNLDLSNNRIHGEIPSWLQSISELKQFDGRNPNLVSFSLANNNLTGEIPPFICNWTGLTILNLSNNRLTGSIPPCLLGEGINLVQLNLRGNQLHGAIPHEISPTCGLQTVDLRDNQLEGILPRSLSNCGILEILDLGNNNLKDTFPYWLGNMSFLIIVVLRSNKFHGLVELPDGNYETNYTFPMLHTFDISSNNFSGNLCVKCFSCFKSMMTNKFSSNNLDGIIESLIPLEPYVNLNVLTIMNKGQLMTLQKSAIFAKSIDFSNNHFEGEIPLTIGQLIFLQVLNLSRNNLTGEIPTQLGKLSKLESLDLSRNSLSGKIPEELVSLHFLSYLSLSYNKLVGKIPQGGQFSTFPNASFEGNEGLCWLLCNTSIPIANNTTTSPPKNKSYMIVLGILFGVGFGVSMAIVLVIDVMYCDRSMRKRGGRHVHG